MPQESDLRLMILVKAAPVPTSNLEETMCVAAMSLDDSPCWIRLHPVPFRDLDDDAKFRKYQEVCVRAIRPKQDRRPESWTPLEGSIKLGETLGTDHGWSTRRERVARLGERTTCELIEANHSGSGPNTPSIATVRTAEAPELLISRRDENQITEWRKRARGIAARPSLFDDPDSPKPVLNVITWRFRYRYRCLAHNCKSHTQTIVDWETVALYRNVRHHSNWQDLMIQKFGDDLWAPDRDTVLFVGNMQQHPGSFLVLGVFWPPRSGLQQSLLR